MMDSNMFFKKRGYLPYFIISATFADFSIFQNMQLVIMPKLGESMH